MFKLITTSLFALAISVSSVSAATSKKIFKGNYDGYANLESVTGVSIYYSPVRFKITGAGVITGTAYLADTKQLVNVTGSIGKVTVKSGFSYIGKASGKFSDGTKWDVEIQAVKGYSAKVITGKARKGSYSGSLQLGIL